VIRARSLARPEKTPSFGMTPPKKDSRRIIRDAGFRPAQRDTLYRQYFLN
jgi:2-iminoacetate synthase ThiH